MARRITTEYVNPPIPIREFDWCAYFPDSHEPGEPQGYGRTREDAIADLLERLAERDSTEPLTRQEWETRFVGAMHVYDCNYATAVEVMEYWCDRADDWRTVDPESAAAEAATWWEGE